MTNDPVWHSQDSIPSDCRELVVTTVECGDWIGLYIADELVYEGHSLPWWKLMPFLDGAYVAEWNRYAVTEEWMEEVGLPKRSSSIPDSAHMRFLEGTNPE